jgi:hypothetical protein
MSDDEYHSNDNDNVLTNPPLHEFADSDFEVFEYEEDVEEDSEWEDSDISEDTSESTEHGSGGSDEESRLEVPSSGPRRSSPVTGTKAEKAAKRIKKGRVQRMVTLEKQKEERQAEAARIKATARKAETERRREVLENSLETLQANGLRFWDLMEFVFNPGNGQGNIRYNEFFVRKSNAPRVLDWWMSAKNRGKRAKAEVREWVIRFATRTMAQEAQAVTKSKEFQTIGRNIDAQVIQAFDLRMIRERLTTLLAPFSMHLLAALTTAKGVKMHTEQRKERTKMVCSLRID